jgi:hypothetical protein
MKKVEAQTVYVAYAPDKGEGSVFQGQPLSIWTKACECPLDFWRTLWKGYEIKGFSRLPSEFATVFKSYSTHH